MLDMDAVDALVAKKEALIGVVGFTSEALILISYGYDTLSLVAVAPKLDVAMVPAAAGPGAVGAAYDVR
ncbi:hypothetical protein MBM_03020 [Drepanopeziza brunnea f. sp. 'multigermtubi' MB_m1]|uniref:Uncharacterized protein n=1 Tax=Marssonina brunnea f. sp. multigermtubi (strain MB_m1) TaxID=1072389 RepID=K1XD73_MARBU|nr:uncharacterized protein MBM_03020 [Drepanopeziza brunnea f. sp. 'multigermtubi' MB_m1]EKD18778.1 hypothetical protein MBM_03020 [Drepanopeziza brunnea f. sp. 'multigermtubi' MB_m1]